MAYGCKNSSTTSKNFLNCFPYFSKGLNDQVAKLYFFGNKNCPKYLFHFPCAFLLEIDITYVLSFFILSKADMIGLILRLSFSE